MSEYRANLLENQRAKLEELKEEFGALFDNAPWIGHGGTPIVDNSTGRMRRKQADKYNDRMRELSLKIEAQKVKIDKTLEKLLPVSVTKKAEKFIKKNPINEALLTHQALKQWEKNPHIFFVKSLKKVALSTFDGVVCINARFPAKTPEDLAAVNLILDDLN